MKVATLIEDNPIYKLFGALMRFGLSLEESAVALTEILYWGTYALVKLFVNPSFSIFHSYNYVIFTLRDQLIILVVLPLVMRYITNIEEFSNNILKEIQANQNVVVNLSRNFYKRLHNPWWNLLMGIILAIIYGSLNVKYIITGARPLDFAIFRFIVLYALLGMSCFIYQQIVLVNFAYNVFSLYQFKQEAYFTRIREFQEIVLLGSFLSVLLSFTLLLTPLILGFYLTSLIWYISLHGFVSAVSLYLFLKAMKGLHESRKINIDISTILPPIKSLKNKNFKGRVLEGESDAKSSIILLPNINMRNYFVFLLISVFLIFFLMILRYLF